jgi:Phosphotransferase enzyme family
VNPLEAAAVAARSHGVRVDKPRVLKDRHNLVVHLAPSPVVARVAQAMSELRPGIRARELELTQWLVARGLPVVPPYVDEVLSAGGHELTLWPLVENERAPDGHAAGRALRAIDDALVACPIDIGGFWPLFEMEALIRLLEVPSFVEEARARIERELAYEPVLLHGDAHFGNCFFTADGPLWTDLEDACLAPPEWDAACLEWPQRLYGRDQQYDAALSELDIPDAERLELLVRLRAVVAITWVTFIQGAIPQLEPMLEWLKRNAP